MAISYQYFKEKSLENENLSDFRTRMIEDALSLDRGIISYVLENGKELRVDYDFVNSPELSSEKNITCNYRVAVIE